MPHRMIHLAAAFVSEHQGYYGSARCSCGFAADHRADSWEVALRHVRESWSYHAIRAAEAVDSDP